MRILICGSRYWYNMEIIKAALKEYPVNSIIIHGDCRGADRVGGEAAGELGMEVEKYPADWNRYGPSAGPIRNAQMPKEGKPDIVLAFPGNRYGSRGTSDMIKKARAQNISVIVHKGNS